MNVFSLFVIIIFSTVNVGKYPFPPPFLENEFIYYLGIRNFHIFLGIGSIPDAVLALLENHKDLGIHTEMFAMGVVNLVRKGAITNGLKPIHRGKIVSSFLIGTKELYDFVDNNPSVRKY